MTRLQSYVNIEGDRSLIIADVCVTKCVSQGDLKPTADGDQCFITKDQIPDTYLPETILYRQAAGLDAADNK